MRTLLLVILCSIGCNTAPAEAPIPGQLDSSGEVITTVNGQNITQGMIDSTMALLPEHVQQQLAAVGGQEKIMEQMVLGELLYREALKRELHKDPKVKTTIALSAREALAQSLLEQIVDERATDEAMQKWYQDHLVQFTQREVDVSHIVVDTTDEALIKQIKATLDKGGDFAALAKKHSTDKRSAVNGGKLGKLTRGRTVPQFEKAAFSTAKGEVSAPVKTQHGWHLILVHDKISTEKPFSEVKDQVKQGISKEIVQAYFEEIKSGATIVETSASGEDGTATKAKGKAKAKNAKGFTLDDATRKKLEAQFKQAKAKKGKKAKGKKAKGKKAKGKKGKKGKGKE